MTKLRNKLAMLELLKEGVGFEKISIVENLDQDDLTKQILSEATRQKIPIEKLPIWKMSDSRSGEVKEVIIGYLAPQKTWHLDKLVENLRHNGGEPFFLLLNKVNLANNIGAITRTAYAAGVNGLIFEGPKQDFYNEDTLHYSLGAIARMPHVKMNLNQALKELKTHNITAYVLDMSGSTYFKENLTGSAAFVLGAEREGVPQNIVRQCDKALSIPMKSGIDSLNVGVSASVVLYEKVRQESV
jgi:23S rRNA (guanosine2251-2'-O)-methyltransferase